jgi:hypothetical protein
MAQKYKDYRKTDEFKNHCALCVKPMIRSYRYWKMMPNDYPYDKIASVHHMIVPIRHVRESELTKEELGEYRLLKETELQEYDYILESTIKNKSIPAHFHLHLIIGNE